MNWIAILGIVAFVAGMVLVLSAVLRHGKVAEQAVPPANWIAEPVAVWPPDPWAGIPEQGDRTSAERTIGVTTLLGELVADPEKADYVAAQASRLAMAGANTDCAPKRYVEAVHAILNVVVPGSMADGSKRALIQTTLEADLEGATLLWPELGAPYNPDIHRAFPPVEAGRHATVHSLVCCGFEAQGYTAPARVTVNLAN